MAALGGEEALRELSEDLRDLCIPRSIERLDASRVLEFLRRFAGRTPCILSGVLDDSLRWGLGELRERLGAQDVTVDATPDGHGDCVRAVCAPDGRRGLSFVMPEERRMPFNEFCDRMEMPQAGDDVLYYSRQNDNMRDAEELASLFEDGGVPGCLPLAAEAFGNAPDAVNLWIGDERAVSSAHRDPYENFYCVLSGTKTFDLLPPPAVALLDEVLVPPSRLRRRGAGAWAAVPTGASRCAGPRAPSRGARRTLPAAWSRSAWRSARARRCTCRRSGGTGCRRRSSPWRSTTGTICSTTSAGPLTR